MKSKGIHITGFILVVIGAINWGLVGLINLNLVELILGSIPVVEKIVYILVGLAGVYLLAMHKGYCKTCGGMGDHKSVGGGAPTPPGAV